MRKLSSRGEKTSVLRGTTRIYAIFANIALQLAHFLHSFGISFTLNASGTPRSSQRIFALRLSSRNTPCYLHPSRCGLHHAPHLFFLPGYELLLTEGRRKTALSFNALLIKINYLNILSQNILFVNLFIKFLKHVYSFGYVSSSPLTYPSYSL